MPVDGVRGRQLLGLCVSVTIALGGMACGAETPAQERAAAPRQIQSAKDLLVTKSDIREAGADTAGGTLLRWWQALQFGDVPTAMTLYSTPPPESELERQLKKLKSILAVTRLEIHEQDTSDGDEARVLAVLRSASFGESGPVISDTPATFVLRREGEDWRLPDNSWVEERYEAQLSAEREARREREREEESAAG